MNSRLTRQTSCKGLPGLAVVGALIILLALVYMLLLRLPTRVYEATDALGYWSAAHLLGHRQNPYDPDGLLALQRQQGWAHPEPHYVWNPPWLVLVLLPLGVLSFRQAAALWFVVSPMLLGLSALLLWHAVSKSRGLPQLSVVLLASFLFSRSLHALLIGQISTLVLFSCAGFLVLAPKRRELLGGALLVLMTAKPIACLLLPTLLWMSLLQRRWRIIVGFSACLMLLMLLVTWVFPSWIQAYVSLFELPSSPQNYPVDRPPTIRGFLLDQINVDVGVWPAVVCLAALLIFVVLRRRSLDFPTVASLALIVGLPAAPFGWSTDQILLLLPILQIVAWMPELTLAQKSIVAILLITTYVYAMWVWLVSYQDSAFVFLPLAVGLAWSYVHWSVVARRQATAVDVR